jgi:hypothetical protein
MVKSPVPVCGNARVRALWSDPIDLIDLIDLIDPTDPTNLLIPTHS